MFGHLKVVYDLIFIDIIYFLTLEAIYTAVEGIGSTSSTKSCPRRPEEGK